MPSPFKAINRDALATQLDAGVREFGLALSTAHSACLLDYLELLVRWNAVYNLTAVRDPRDMVTRHLLDSLAIAPLVRGATLTDLGSGAGLPGIPLAIIDPQRQVTLVDSNGKKIRFLREAVRVLGLQNVQIEQVRAEDFPGEFDCVVARAFASIAQLIEVGGHLLARAGCFIAMKGQIDAAEIAALPAGFVVSEIVPLAVPGLGAARHAVIIKHSSFSPSRG